MCVILYWLADATWAALKAMAGQVSPRTPLCGPSSPNTHVVAKEGEGESSLLLVTMRASLFCTEHGSMAVVVGRFVPLAFIAFFLGRTSTPQEEEEEEADEEEEEVLAYLEDAETLATTRRIRIGCRPWLCGACILLWLPFPIRAATRGFRVRRSLAINCLCHLQSDLWFHHHWDFFGTLLLFRIIPTNYNPFRQIKGVWWHRGMAPCQVSFDVQNPRSGTREYDIHGACFPACAWPLLPSA